MMNSKGFGYYVAAISMVAFFAFYGNKAEAGGEDFYSNIIRLEKIVSKIDEKYVEEVQAEELVNAAISGMREILDPHTAYFSQKDYDDLKIHTAGEFGGLGITIGIRNKILTVISPLRGTPAFRMGIQAGDKIIKIDTLSTKGITIDEAVENLRGKPGSEVTIQVLREGMMEPIEFTIVRDIIKIESVPYAGLLNESVGYIQVTQFSKRTGEDLYRKINELKKENIESLVLDLRYNPGGLLDQAIEVSELFLEKGQMVVFTKGRDPSQNHEFRSRKGAFWNKKLVVLVDEHSASASEIVAGAIQDWDRGLVIGENTFGKGSVQTILPIDGQKNALKLTTAYYYTPSGRCINKPENAAHNVETGNVVLDEMGEEPGEKDVQQQDSVYFKTKAGRKVMANGGIKPDIHHEGEKTNRFVIELLRKTKFFNFAIKNKVNIQKTHKITPDFEVDEKLIEDFREFVFSDSVFENYKSASLLALGSFKEVLKKEKEIQTGDNEQIQAELQSTIDQLEKQLRADAIKEFDRNTDYIKFNLKAELLGVVLGQDAQQAFKLQHDPQVKEAVRHLNDNDLYTSVLTPSKMAESKAKK